MDNPALPVARSFVPLLCWTFGLARALLLLACGGGSESSVSNVTPVPAPIPTQSPGPGPTTPPIEYTNARERWNVASIRDYRYTFSRACLCPADGPILVIVRAGVVSQATYATTGLNVDSTRMAWIPTLAGMFEKADLAYAQGAASVRFTVNSTHGFLTSLDIDYSAQMFDEELHYTASNLVLDPLP